VLPLTRGIGILQRGRVQKSNPNEAIYFCNQEYAKKYGKIEKLLHLAEMAEIAEGFTFYIFRKLFK